MVYFRAKDFEKSDKAFEDALNLNPKEPYLLHNYSFHLAARGARLEKAKELAAMANELAPKQADFQDTYGWVLYQLKDYAAAKDWIGRALANGGDQEANILEHYGDVLFQTNEKEEALQYWKKAAELGTASDGLLKKLAEGGIEEQ